jgi:hypothetical protein
VKNPPLGFKKLKLNIGIFKNIETLNKNKMEERGGPNWTCFAPLF